jgi:hypothetical protein
VLKIVSPSGFRTGVGTTTRHVTERFPKDVRSTHDQSSGRKFRNRPLCESLVRDRAERSATRLLRRVSLGQQHQCERFLPA